MKPVSKTAYYCAGVRMLDAESPNPLIGDSYARPLLGEEGLKYWQEFKDFKAPIASNRARHYLIEEAVKKILHEEPGSTVILIGAGLDSRSFRLQGGNWVEIDEEAIIHYKNGLLPPSTCPNKLNRIAINFATEKLADKLAPYAGSQDVVIIIEGVLMYLGETEKEELLKTLTGLFSSHVLFCDLMTKEFFEKLGRPIENKFREFGASFTDMRDKPADLFLAYGYKLQKVTSTIKAASEKGIFPAPGFLVNVLLRKYLMGYAVYQFKYNNNN